VRITQDAFFLRVAEGERFCVWRAPASTPASGIVVHVPAFAEEMNKARHVTAACARALAGRGFGVLQFDLQGCGDSPGDFGDASWNIWIDDVVAASHWARARGSGPLWLWGLRAGALLAAAALRRLPEPVSLLLWQPVLSGRQHLTQFLRLAVAAGVLADNAERTGTRLLQERVAQGHTLEIAGYRLSPELCEGLAVAEFRLPDGYEGPVIWFEIAGGAAAGPSPALAGKVAALGAQGIGVGPHTVQGAGFWQSVEIEDSPALIEATVVMLAGPA
jgi:uncharacterized protein